MTGHRDSSSASDAVVLRAIADEDLDAIEDLADRWWYELPGRFGTELLDLLGRLPDTVTADRPRLLVAGLHAHELTVAPQDAGLCGTLQAFAEHGARLQRRLTYFTRPGDVLAAGLLALISARRRGAYDVAERIGEWVERRTSSLGEAEALPWSGRRVAGRPGLLSLHRGVTQLLAGDAGQASAHFARAYAQAGPAPFQHFAGAAACANLALLAAVQGYHGLAGEWLERSARCGPVPAWLEHHLVLGARIAEAQLAIDGLDRSTAERALAHADAGRAGELWPFLAAVRAAFAATFGCPVEGLHELDATGLAHGIATRPGPDLGGQLLRARADLLVALGGDGDPVLALRRHGNPSVLAPPAARVYLLGRRPDRALAVAERALGDPAVSPRDTAELQLVCAVAHLRRGDGQAGCRAFMVALRLRDQGLLRPFAHVPSEDLRELCRLTATDSARLAPALAHETGSAPVSLLALTSAEEEVLTALAAGATTTRIAAHRGVSVNTVRTQVKSLYRKLGASDRSAALARAARLQLVAHR